MHTERVSRVFTAPLSLAGTLLVFTGAAAAQPAPPVNAHASPEAKQAPRCDLGVRGAAWCHHPGFHMCYLESMRIGE